MTDDKLFPVELRAARVRDLSCLHVWNHLPGKAFCPICLDNHVKANLIQHQQFSLLRGFYRHLNPFISKEEIARLEREKGPKIVIAFKLTGKRGKTYALALSPSGLDSGGIFIELFEGHYKDLGKRKSLAGAIVATVEFEAVGALLQKKAPPLSAVEPDAVTGEVDLNKLYGTE